MKTLLATSFIIALSFQAPSALAQSAPGALADIATLSTDLQNSRNSASSIHAQAEQIRQLKLLAAREATSLPDAAPFPDQAEEPGAEAGDVMVTIPTGSGLVPARNKRSSFKHEKVSETGAAASFGLPAASLVIQGSDLN